MRKIARNAVRLVKSALLVAVTMTALGLAGAGYKALLAKYPILVYIIATAVAAFAVWIVYEMID
jgi:threonine/homoserine/homoserine lactone efflux protein